MILFTFIVSLRYPIPNSNQFRYSTSYEKMGNNLLLLLLQLLKPLSEVNCGLQGIKKKIAIDFKKTENFEESRKVAFRCIK